MSRSPGSGRGASAMRQIKFKASGANSVLGGFSSGDTARVDDAFAAHLVNEARVAVYLDAAPAPAAVDPAKPPKTPRRKPKE